MSTFVRNRQFGVLLRYVRVILPGLLWAVLTAGVPLSSHAALLSYNDPTCDGFDLQNNGNGSFTLICVSGGENSNRPTNCSVTLSSPAVMGKAGGPVTISGSCTTNVNGATAYSWMRTASDTGNTITYPGSSALTNNPVPANNGEADVVYTYTFFACNGSDGADCSYPISRTVTVVTTTEPPIIDPPTGCTVLSSSTSSVPSSGGTATLNGSCTGNVTGSTTYSWSRSPVGGGFPKTGTSVSDTFGSNTGASETYYYTMTACNADKCATTSSWMVTRQGVTQPTAPTGCNVTPTTTISLPNTGGTASWTASCSGNTTGSTTYTWTRSPTDSTYPKSGTTVSENLSANNGTSAVTYTYTMKACNGTACAADITRTATVAPAGSGSNLCAGFSEIPVNFPKGTAQYTANNFGGSKVFVGNFVASTNGKIAMAALNNGAQGEVMASISEHKCDFRAVDTTGVNGPKYITYTTGATGGKTYTVGGTGLVAGRTYYVNAIARNDKGVPQCTSSNCNYVFGH